MSTDAAVPRPVVALSGGVGGAKLVDGLAQRLPAAALTVIVNTADDFRRYGLAISPDVDTVLYTLAGLANPATGWGLAGDTDAVMTALRRLGEAAWFHLGDRDLATHLLRSGWLGEGVSPTEVTRRLSRLLGVTVEVLPMSDDPVATAIETAGGAVPFQEWFVRDRCRPPARAVHYTGIARARPAAAVTAALGRAALVVLGPSNPYLSLGPILALPGLREQLQGAPAPVVAVSPIVGGRALKGPAAEMLADLAGGASCLAVARLLRDVVDGLVIDRADAELAPAVGDLGIAVRVADTVMRSPADRCRLAMDVLAFGDSLGGRAQEASA